MRLLTWMVRHERELRPILVGLHLLLAILMMRSIHSTGPATSLLACSGMMLAYVSGAYIGATIMLDRFSRFLAQKEHRPDQKDGRC